MIKQIIKRDGRRRKFDVRKINAAIYKAQLACGQDDIETVYAITDKVSINPFNSPFILGFKTLPSKPISKCHTICLDDFITTMPSLTVFLFHISTTSIVCKQISPAQ